jgi:hypothetical protein
MINYIQHQRIRLISININLMSGLVSRVTSIEKVDSVRMMKLYI